MRKIVVLSFISLDGVMQAPGGPDEDTSDGFKFGGWTVPFFDEVSGNLMNQQDGPMLQVHGSGNMIQTLLQNDLVDELWQKIYPVTLGGGKRLFDQGVIPAAFELIDCNVTPIGVIFASYCRAGAVKTGSFQ